MIYSVVLFQRLIIISIKILDLFGRKGLCIVPLWIRSTDFAPCAAGEYLGILWRWPVAPGLPINRWALVSHQGVSEHIWCRKFHGWSSFSGKKWPNMWVPIFRHTHTWEDDHFHVEALVEFPNQLSFVDQQLCGPYWVVKEGLGWWIRHLMVVVPVVHYFGLPRQPEARERWRRLQCTPTWAKKNQTVGGPWFGISLDGCSSWQSELWALVMSKWGNYKINLTLDVCLIGLVQPADGKLP